MQKRIPLEELFRLPILTNVTPSTLRDRFAYFSNRTGRMELYVREIANGHSVQMTNGELPKAIMTGFLWSRDDKAIIFTKDKDGDEQHNLYRFDLETGQTRQLTDEPKGQKFPVAVSPDGQHLSVTSDRRGQMNLFTLDLTSGEWQQLTSFPAPVDGGYFSPDGAWLAFASNETSNLNNTDIYLVSRDGASTRKLLSAAEGSKDRPFAFHPGGELLGIESDASGVSRVGLLQLASGAVQWLGEEGIEEYGVEFAPSGRFLVTIRNRDAATAPILYHVESGEAHALKLPAGVTFGAQFIQDDTKLLITHSAANRRTEVLLYDLATDSYEVLIPAEYGSIDPALFVTEEYVHYPSADGQLVPAILYRPRAIPPGIKLPALVDAHGGPTAQYFRNFDSIAQLLVDRGFVLIQPNFRGSTGYGTAWRDANIGDLGGKDLDDVVAGADYLATLPYVDGERIGIFGGSYGGYLTFMATTKRPERFKAGAASVGITDWKLLWDESMEHFRYYIRQILGDPEKDLELFRDRSGLTFAHQLKAKLLIQQGENDPRVPVSQARVFRDRLLALGKQEGVDFEYEEFPAGHGAFGDADQTIKIFRRTVDFLERSL